MSYENFVKTKVVTPLAIDTTSFAIEAASAPNKLPPLDGGLLVLCDSPGNPSFIEVIRYGYRTDLALYEVQRGQEGTAAREWTGPTYCFQSLMAGEFNAMVATLAGKEPAIEPGNSSQYWTGSKTWGDFYGAVRSATLTGLSLASGVAVVAGDNVLGAVGKLQKQISDIVANLAANVRATVLTGYIVGTDTDVAATDSVLTAVQKLQGQMNARALLTGVGATGTWPIGISGLAATATTLTGMTATVAELNHTDGVTSNIQTQLNGKAASSHTHTVANVSGLQAALDAKLDSTSEAGYARLGTTTPPVNYLYTARADAVNFAMYVRQGGNGPIATFFANATEGSTTGTGQVQILNNGSVTTTSGMIQKGAGNATYDFGIIHDSNGYMNFARYTKANAWSATLMTISDTGVVQANGGFSGNGAALSSLNAANLSSGIVPDARLSGTYNGVNISGTAGSIAGFNNPTTDSTPSRIAYRDTAADIHARLFRSEYADGSTMSGGLAFRVNNSTDNFIRTCSNPKAVSDWLRIGLTAVGSTADPNTTVEHEILTNHANSPGLSRHWYITTTFYSAIGTSSNRSQIAVSYTGDTRVYARQYASGSWSSWQVCGEDSGEINPTLVNSFTQGTTPLQYRKVNGIVSIVGQVNRSAMPLGTTIFTLPVGYRPGKNTNCLGELYGTGNLQRTAFSFAALSTGAFNAIWTASPSTGDTPTGPFTFNINISFPAA